MSELSSSNAHSHSEYEQILSDVAESVAPEPERSPALVAR